MFRIPAYTPQGIDAKLAILEASKNKEEGTDLDVYDEERRWFHSARADLNRLAEEWTK